MLRRRLEPEEIALITWMINLTTMGIKTESQLLDVFKRVFREGRVISTKADAHGVSVTKEIGLGSKGSVRVSFFYENGVMASTPRVSTIIPRTRK